MKKSPLYYVFMAIIGLSFIFIAWPNILGWNTQEIWVIGMPVSQFCIYLFPLLIILGMGGLYLIDYQYEKKKALSFLEKNQENGGEEKC